MVHKCFEWLLDKAPSMLAKRKEPGIWKPAQAGPGQDEGLSEYLLSHLATMEDEQKRKRGLAS
eukprot:1594834-Amphidinium_carterae.1